MVIIRRILIVSRSRLIVGEIVLGRVACAAAAAAEQSAVFGDRDKSRGALLSEGKHYLRVATCEAVNERTNERLRQKFLAW